MNGLPSLNLRADVHALTLCCRGEGKDGAASYGARDPVPQPGRKSRRWYVKTLVNMYCDGGFTPIESERYLF